MVDKSSWDHMSGYEIPEESVHGAKPALGSCVWHQGLDPWSHTCKAAFLPCSHTYGPSIGFPHCSNGDDNAPILQASETCLNKYPFSQFPCLALYLANTFCLQRKQPNTHPFRKAILFGRAAHQDTATQRGPPKACRKLCQPTIPDPSIHQHQGTLSHNPHLTQAQPFRREMNQEQKKQGGREEKETLCIIYI